MNRVYLDYAASAPLSPEAQEVIEQFLNRKAWGNPSSLHAEGRSMQALLDKAHTTVAAVFGFDPTDVIFTSGATESNNLIIRGVLQAWHKEPENAGAKPHVVLTAIEHPSWRQTVNPEDTDITIVPVSSDGVVDAEAMLAAITPHTALVGCMYVNNEIGTVQPVATIGKGVEAWREQHHSTWPIFHVDAVQAFPYLNTHKGHLHADSVTISGHKYGALGGSGALLVSKHVPLEMQQRGGAQEWGKRAGTENVLGALTLAEVVEYGDAHRDDLTQHAQTLQHQLDERLAQEHPDIRIIGQSAERSPHITYLWLPQVTDEHFVHKLDLAGFAVSSGSACSSGALLPSVTLLALGMTPAEAYGGVRISYGRGTTADDIDQFCDALASLLS